MPRNWKKSFNLESEALKKMSFKQFKTIYGKYNYDISLEEVYVKVTGKKIKKKEVKKEKLQKS